MPNLEQDILHQAEVEGVISENLDERLGVNTVAELSTLITTTIATELGDNTALADLAAPSATYVEAEAVAITNKINAILAALRESKIIPLV